MAAPVSIPLQVVAMKCNGAVPANSVVKLDTVEGQVLVTTAITEFVFGVAQNTGATGEMISVEIGYGAIVKLIATAAIAVGARVMPGALGRVTTSAGATAVDCGVALSACSNAGEVVYAVLRPQGLGPVNV